MDCDNFHFAHFGITVDNLGYDIHGGRLHLSHEAEHTGHAPKDLGISYYLTPMTFNS